MQCKSLLNRKYFCKFVMKLHSCHVCLFIKGSVSAKNSNSPLLLSDHQGNRPALYTHSSLASSWSEIKLWMPNRSEPSALSSSKPVCFLLVISKGRCWLSLHYVKESEAGPQAETERHGIWESITLSGFTRILSGLDPCGVLTGRGALREMFLQMKLQRPLTSL